MAKRKTSPKTTATKAASTTTVETKKTTVTAAPAEVKETKAAVKEEPVTIKTTETKAPAKKAAKAAEVVVETFFEFEGNQIMAEELVTRIKEAYKAEGHRIGNIKTLRTYINPAERRAYYVINDKVEDKYIEF